ncbi:MAG: carboxylesterase family protein [Clostridiales bacterium]|nr:carboxylesterase family protein [Clostridiales bacterium]
MTIIKAVTTNGIVVGMPGKQTECTMFLGIPYAKPPVGELRYQAPQKAENWEGERECFTFSPACIQDRKGEDFPISEDCLYLNVYTPAKTADEKLPVMFWIYGGGFGGGRSSDPEMYGESLTRKDVVVVTINYRCGVFGFFAAKELEERNGQVVNAGILDQIAALTWVRENIHAFGGDPERILVFGQSAGGMSTRMLMTSPLAKGMFSRAIIESGGGLNEADPIRPKEEFMALCERAMQHLGWTLEDMLTRDAAEVSEKMAQAAKDTAEGFEVGYFQPFLDGVSLMEVPGKLIARGEYPDIPIICGTVAGDAWMFSRKVMRQFPNDRYFRGFSYAASQAWARLCVKEGRTPIYTYYMDRTQPKKEGGPTHGRAPAYGAGTPHSSEIVYVFGTLDSRSKGFGELDSELSEAMQTYWTNFAKTGDPNKDPNKDATEDLTGEGICRWEPYTAETPLAMHFGDEGYQMTDLVETDAERLALKITEEHPGLLTSLEGYELK